MKDMLRKLLKNIGFVLAIHFLCLVSLSACRLLLLFSNMPTSGVDGVLAWHALLIGVKFDNLIACYVSALPLLCITISTMALAHRAQYGSVIAKLMGGIGGYYVVIYSIGLPVEVANTRYFQFFDNHLNISVTEWFAFAKDTAGMLIGDKGNWPYLLIAIVFVGIYLWALVRIVCLFERHIDKSTPVLSCKDYAAAIGVSILMYGLGFCGIRGSFQRYPLGVSFAYFCDDAFYNRLGINPIFNIIKSAEYTSEDLPVLLQIDEQEALAAVQQELDMQVTDSFHPLVRHIAAKEGLGKRNVVVILMESMSTAHLEETYQGKHITPYLAALRDSSLYFSNFYSAGVHTNNGITATLYGYGPNFAKTTMTVPSHQYMGLPFALKQNGYSTFVFVTGNPQYDNMNSFFYDNSIERIFSLYDYPADKVVNNFGVPDDYMFTYGLDYLKLRSAATEQPFFALFLTVSNHTPFVIPDRYRPMGANEEQQIIAYADDALRQFMLQAQQTEWGKNTLFVLVGDHGNPSSTPYDYNLQYNTVPCFFVTEDLRDTIISSPAQQQDIAPTLLSILGLPYTDNTMGIDLLKKNREYAYFVNNDHLGCCDGEWLYSYSINTQKEYLYHLPTEQERSVMEYTRLEKMRKYAVQHQLVNIKAVANQWTSPNE